MGQAENAPGLILARPIISKPPFGIPSRGQPVTMSANAYRNTA